MEEGDTVIATLRNGKPIKGFVRSVDSLYDDYVHVNAHVWVKSSNLIKRKAHVRKLWYYISSKKVRSTRLVLTEKIK
jgi:hypothetical protein